MNPAAATGVLRLGVNMEQPDEELIGGVIRKEQEAFAVLFRRYRQTVHSHLVQILRDSAAADDLTQEVFLRLWHRADQWKQEAAFRSWLLRIATNLAFNHLRTLKRRRETSLEPPSQLTDDEDDSLVPGWMIDASTPDPGELLAQAEQRQLLRQIVRELSAEKQEVFRLIHDAEMETREVASQLGIPEGTVKSRIHHARKQIARSWRQLAAEWEDDR
jgi:RNA polymerase sigma-70 factor, ECF subfamily